MRKFGNNALPALGRAWLGTKASEGGGVCEGGCGVVPFHHCAVYFYLYVCTEVQQDDITVITVRPK